MVLWILVTFCTLKIYFFLYKYEISYCDMLVLRSRLSAVANPDKNAPGELYKPDSQSLGGGVGNGGGFDIEEFLNEENNEDKTLSAPQNRQENTPPQTSVEPMPEESEGGTPSEMQNFPNGFNAHDFNLPEGEVFPDLGREEGRFDGKAGANGFQNEASEKTQGAGMNSDDVKLKYIDDYADSYPNIFNNAKTDITETDENRLIASLKALSEGGDVSEVVDTEAVINYFVVHNFVVNGGSYTGSMVHNYYLYEENGVLSMIPWDYNLAFGGFAANAQGASAAVNSPIDSPVSRADISDRPMAMWIFESEEYTEEYHSVYAEFTEKYFESGYFTELIDKTSALISHYVKSDPMAFCTYEQFEAGVKALKEFCLFRAESVTGQLNSTIPSTSEAQALNEEALIDASELELSDMGTMNSRGMKKEQ